MLKRAFVFANGLLEDPPPIIKEIGGEDLVIAADGGSHHCKSLGITPHVIIGDFDSLDEDALEDYTKKRVELISYPRVKNETDLELALSYAQDQGAQEVFIIAAFGQRWDMTLANIMLAAHQKLAKLIIRLVDGRQEIRILRGGNFLTIEGRVGAELSLIPIEGDAQGITTHGVEYPLQEETLIFGSPRGVSNTIVTEQARISLTKGTLVVCLASQALESSERGKK